MLSHWYLPMRIRVSYDTLILIFILITSYVLTSHYAILSSYFDNISNSRGREGHGDYDEGLFGFLFTRFCTYENFI